VVGPVDADVVDFVLAVAQFHDTVDERLAAYKRPRQVVFLYAETLPRSNDWTFIPVGIIGPMPSEGKAGHCFPDAFWDRTVLDGQA
jgi:hypothetical protein